MIKCRAEMVLDRREKVPGLEEEWVADEEQDLMVTAFAQIVVKRNLMR